MEVKKVYPSGFCKGVVRAIDLAIETRKNNPKDKIYVLGNIVHNGHVRKQLEELDIITLDDKNKTKVELLNDINEGIVIFTAHGIADSIKNLVIEKGLKYVDASCEDVLKTKEIIIDYLNKGYDILYIGVSKHPEAEAILSISEKIHLITRLEDIEEININNNKIFVTNQTTLSFLDLFKIFESIKNKYPNVIISDETCNATRSRQEAIINLKDCDLLYVVGDSSSNNTNKLVEIGKESGIKKIFLINTYKDIDDDDLIGINNIYITAGASTPKNLIDDVFDYLHSKSLQ